MLLVVGYRTGVALGFYRCAAYTSTWGAIYINLQMRIHSVQSIVGIRNRKEEDGLTSRVQLFPGVDSEVQGSGK